MNLDDWPKKSLEHRGLNICQNCKHEIDGMDILWSHEKAWRVWIVCRKCKNEIACIEGKGEIYEERDVCDIIESGELLHGVSFPNRENARFVGQ